MHFNILYVYFINMHRMCELFPNNNYRGFRK